MSSAQTSVVAANTKALELFVPGITAIKHSELYVFSFPRAISAENIKSPNNYLLSKVSNPSIAPPLA